MSGVYATIALFIGEIQSTNQKIGSNKLPKWTNHGNDKSSASSE